RHRHAVALGDAGDARTNPGDDTDALMSRYEREWRLDRPVTVGGVYVGVAETRGLDLDDDLAGTRLGDRQILDLGRAAVLADDGSAHGMTSSLLRRSDAERRASMPASPRMGPSHQGRTARPGGRRASAVAAALDPAVLHAGVAHRRRPGLVVDD